MILWQPANDARADFADPEHGAPACASTTAAPTRPAISGSARCTSARTCRPASGKLFRVNADGSSSIEKSGIGITNTFCWSPDNPRFYFGDTLANAISVWDYDLGTGSIANERPFFVGFDRGGPDGSAMDRDGYLWNARYGGGCIVRIAPNGEIDRIVEMPVTNVTTCTFGGPQLKTLFITTAMRRDERLSGGLYALAVDVPGLPENLFRLSG